jgi:hypothetical protein
VHRTGEDGWLEVSNSLAVDEDGGIYIVTHKNMNKVRISLPGAWGGGHSGVNGGRAAGG